MSTPEFTLSALTSSPPFDGGIEDTLPSARPPSPDAEPASSPGAATVAPRCAREEPRSPFLDPAAEPGPSLDALVEAQTAARPLVLELVSDIDGVVARLRDAARLERVATTALAVTVLACGIHAAGLMGPYGAWPAARAAGLSAFSVLLGIAAALGPIYATSVVAAARLPMGRLVGVLLAATAAGALVLAGLTPVTRLALAWDPVWIGPLAQVGAFALMGACTGLRLWRLLHRLAEAGAGGALSSSARFRVGILARMALAFSGLTICLAIWAFDAFLLG